MPLSPTDAVSDYIERSLGNTLRIGHAIHSIPRIAKRLKLLSAEHDTSIKALGIKGPPAPAVRTLRGAHCPKGRINSYSASTNATAQVRLQCGPTRNVGINPSVGWAALRHERSASMWSGANAGINSYSALTSATAQVRLQCDPARTPGSTHGSRTVTKRGPRKRPGATDAGIVDSLNCSLPCFNAARRERRELRAAQFPTVG